MRRVIGVAIILACLAPALALARPADGPDPRTKKGGDTHYSGMLRIAMPEASVNVDPAFVADEQNVQLANLLYSGLVRLDPHYRVIPGDAARYTVSRDHLTYTFYLRHDLRFSNGDPVTASDYRFAITRNLRPALKSPSASTYLLDIQGAAAVLAGKATSVRGIKVIDRYTLQIRARWALPYFLMELTYPTSFALDEKQIRKLGPVDNTSWYAHPVGSGPYRLKSWVPNSTLDLVPNKHYPGAGHRPDHILISLAALPAADVYDYVARSVDIAALPPNESLLRLDGVRETQMLAIDGVYMNLWKKPFKDPQVRRALTLALDRPKLVDRALGSSFTPFGGYVPPGQLGYDRALRPPRHNRDAARAMLQSAGYADGGDLPRLTLYYADDPRIAKLAIAIAKQWKKALKISVDPRALTLNTLLAKVQSGSLPLYLGGWSADYPDPHDWLSNQWKSTALNNDVHYSNRRFDTLVDAADVTWSLRRRLHLYDRAQQVLVGDAAWIPLYVPHRFVYIRPGVSNLVLTGLGVIPRWGSWATVQIHPLPTTRALAVAV